MSNSNGNGKGITDALSHAVDTVSSATSAVVSDVTRVARNAGEAVAVGRRPWRGAARSARYGQGWIA